jgi:hypothetical protein
MKRPKLTVIQGGKKDPAPFPFELFFPWMWFWWK